MYPSTHYVTPKERVHKAVDEIRDELRTRLLELHGAGKLVEAQRLQQRTLFDLEMMNEVGLLRRHRELLALSVRPQAGEPPPCLFDYLPKNALLVIDESHQTIPQLGAMYKGDRSRKETLVEYGFRLPSALDNRPLRFEEFEHLAPQTIYVSATPGLTRSAFPARSSSRWCGPTGLIDPAVEMRPVRAQVDDLAVGDPVARAGQRTRAGDHAHQAHGGGSDRISRTSTASRCATCTRISRRSSARKSSAICASGKFDVIVGINLLREGLDMPEVSLVAILDADKEGFLRSEGSLIQTIGRAARNVQGKAILYADVRTGSIERAIAETDRRRNKQIEFNAAARHHAAHHRQGGGRCDGRRALGAGAPSARGGRRITRCCRPSRRSSASRSSKRK